MSIIRTALTAILIAFSGSASAQLIDESIQNLAATLGEQLTKAGTQKLAVAGFSQLNGSDTALGDFVAEELTTALFSAGDFVIVERREYNQILQEQERYGSGSFNQEQLPEIGKQLGVDAIITGSITSLGTQVRINARAVSVETTRVFAAAATTADRNENIDILLGQRPLLDNVASASTPGLIPQLSEAVYENDFLRVSPENVIISEDGSEFTVATRFHNTSEELVKIAFAAVDRNLGKFMSSTTSYGELFQWTDGHMTGVKAVDASNELYNESEFTTTISPGKTITVLWKAKTVDGSPIKGDKLSLQAKFVRYIGPNRVDYIDFNVALDGILIKK